MHSFKNPKELSVYFITLNYFTIPQVKYIEAYFAAKGVKRILIRDFNVKYNVSFSNKAEYRPFKTFETYNASRIYFSGFFNQVKRYGRVLTTLIVNYLKPGKKVFYIMDHQLLPALSMLKRFKPRNCKVIYHEFEVVTPRKGGDTGVWKNFSYRTTVNAADMILIPEKNREDYFLANTFLRDKCKIKLFVNSCPSKSLQQATTLIPGISKDDFIIGHIGNAGAEHHLVDLLSAFKKFEKYPNVKILFVGNQSSETQEIFETFNLENCYHLSQVKHEELDAIYARLDLGLILYRDIDINYKYCAPNKLYEYWAYNIPVLANRLPGIEEVFSQSYLGKLIDFNSIDEVAWAIKDAILKGRARETRIKDFFDKNLSIEKSLKQLDFIFN